MNKTEELIQIIKEHPDRELIFMYPEEGSDHPYTLGYPSRILIDDYVTIDDRVWLKKEDGEELLNDIKDSIAFTTAFKEYPNAPSQEQEQEISKQAGAQFESQPWKKAIVVYIRP